MMLKTFTIAAAAAAIVASATVADAATSHRRHHATHHSNYAYQDEGYGYSRYPDPTRGPGTAQMRYFQSLGRCVIDEGYGRFTFCDGGY